MNTLTHRAMMTTATIAIAGAAVATAITNAGPVPAAGAAANAAPALAAGGRFDGAFFAGVGDTEYLQLLDISRRMFEPDPEFQNMPMLYTPAWNGLVEGPTWDAWWIQNSYGTTYCALPFYQEPFVRFLENSHDLWFDQMGDGKRKGAPPPHDWIAPDGCLCDAARPGWVVYRQGDGWIQMHDWAVEFTAAGLLMQAELLLIGRDEKAIAHNLPRLERSAHFIETRRDPKNNLFLAGPAANLLGPSYAGWKKPDGTYDKAYLAGLSITYIAALDRLIELETLAGRADQAKLYTARRDLAKKGLPAITTDEGYFIKSLDPDGTRHGVYGAAKHGYIETPPNHDAIAFRVVDDAHAERIYAKIAAIPEVRPHAFILPNHPSLDDMYEKPEGIWKFGHWVNGGHWSTCEGRMILAYARLARYEDIRRSMRQLLKFARAFRMDNPLVDFGDNVYQPQEAINLCYDTFAPPAAMIRGLFEYLYRADDLTILPHIPPAITRLEQRFPIRFGTKRLFLATTGRGDITGVTVNGKLWSAFDRRSVRLPYGKTPDRAVVEILLGGATPTGPAWAEAADRRPAPPDIDKPFWKSLRPAAAIAVNDLPLRIGADSNGDNRFVGDIASVRVFSRALAANEVAALARSRSAGPPGEPALIAEWVFDAPTPGGFANRAGTLLPARIVGEAAVVDAVGGGRALRLTGAGYLEVAPDEKLNLTTECTLEAWICPKSLPASGGRILDKSRAGTADGYDLDTTPGNSLRLIVQSGSVGHDARLAPDQWAHVAATVEAEGRLTLYLNGTPVAVQSPPPMPPVYDLVVRVRDFYSRLLAAGLGDTYEAAHARLAVQYAATTRDRYRMLADGKLARLPDRSQAAADRSYLDTTAKLCKGLQAVIAAYANSEDAQKKEMHRLWSATGGAIAPAQPSQ